MRKLISAVFLTIILCVLPANSTVLAKESKQSSRVTFVRPRQANHNRSFRDTLWEKKFNDWEKRQRAVPVPKSLPRVTNFKAHRHSSSKSFKSSHRGFRASHSHRSRHVRRTRTHVRRRSRR